MLIELNDLRHSINRALNLGRYQVVVKTAGGEQVPASITLDLLERDDDGFAEFSNELARREHLSDDHGPSVPSQTSVPAFNGSPDPIIYEFAVQDICGGPLHETLSTVGLDDAPDSSAVSAADFVHVYDRVTRERRTLKRPEPDAVLTGLQDVAAALRGKADMTALGEAFTEVALGAAERRSSPGKWRVYRDGEKIVYETFDQPEPAADPMPPVGPLTSTEGLKAGDILFLAEADFGLVRYDGYVQSRTIGVQSIAVPGRGRSADFSEFAFVARPGFWMPWKGGENPVPGMSVKVETHSKGEEEGRSEHFFWRQMGDSGYNIIRYMVVDTPPSSSET